MSKILGISAYFHDSSACLIVDGRVVAAISEERLSRVKHDASFPQKSIVSCLEIASLTIADLDEVIFFEKPFTKFDRILDTFLTTAPRGFLPFRKAILGWFKEKMWVEDVFRKRFGYKGTFSYCQHHLSHAALACAASGFETAAYVIIDGVGERACTSYGTYGNGKFSPIAEQQFPHSIGLLYSAFTAYCGFKVNSGEYKLMGLAPYGKPVYKQLILDNLVTFSDEGVVTLNLRYVGFLDDLRMTNRRFEKLFDRPARTENQPMDDFYKDVAASIQSVLEDGLAILLNYIRQQTGATKLIYGGGVALNCVANAELITRTGFEELFIHSASGDSGCAMGAAFWAAMQRNEIQLDSMSLNQEFLGPEYSTEEIKTALRETGITAFYELEWETLTQTVAGELAQDKVVCWFQGKMEFGPRALGNRSILAKATHPDMKSVLNQKIKKREGFRPFAPVVLADYFQDYFEDQGNDYSRMLYVTQGTEKAQEIPACIHNDGSARAQRLEPGFNDSLHSLLIKYHDLTGIPVLINTSFNERGEPMVCSPQDAIRCFLNTEIDVLVMGNLLVYKSEVTDVEHKTIVYAPD
ncbi:MAG: carbamoyltransferase N-terminal domain-containing protein [Bacteroidota bacterium]